MKSIILGVNVLLILLNNTCSIIDPDLESYSDYDAEIIKEMNENQIPSLSACVVRNDRIVWQNHYGNNSVNDGIPDSSTIFPTASVSKTIVVTAIMQLHEQDLINLEADINDYLPFSVRNSYYPDRIITIRYLLTHTSGLAWPVDDYEVPGLYDYHPYDSAPPLNEWIPEYVLPEGNSYVNAVWKNTIPGKSELYSNIGTAILGFIVEIVSGTDFNSYCKQNIFEPLEMYSTSYAYEDLDMNKLVKIYWDNYEQISYYRQLHYPAQSLKTTIKDYSHFLISYMNGGIYNGVRILQESSVSHILQLNNPASGVCLIWNKSLGNWYEHAGGEPGVGAQVLFHQENKMGIIIFSNKRNGSVYIGGKIHALVKRVAGEYQ
jgi:CubicO group peptidase (beta-lactamase class C family)